MPKKQMPVQKGRKKKFKRGKKVPLKIKLKTAKKAKESSENVQRRETRSTKRETEPKPPETDPKNTEAGPSAPDAISKVNVLSTFRFISTVHWL